MLCACRKYFRHAKNQKISAIVDSSTILGESKMAHRCIIGIEYPDSSISAIYVGHGGYPSDGSSVPKILFENYSNTEAMEQIIRFSETNGLSWLPSAETWKKYDAHSSALKHVYNWHILPDRISSLAADILGCQSMFWHNTKHHNTLPDEITGDIDDVLFVADIYCCEYVYLWSDENSKWKSFEIDENNELVDISENISKQISTISSVKADDIKDSISAAIEHIKNEYSGIRKPRTTQDIFTDKIRVRFNLRELHDEEMRVIVKCLIPKLEKEPRAKQLLAETTGGLDEEIEPYDFTIIMDIDENKTRNTDIMTYFIKDLIDEYGIHHFIYLDILSTSQISLRPPEEAAWTRENLISD